jgi:flagellin-like hook-associated protein FlgL
LTGTGVQQTTDELVKSINSSSVSENVRASNDNGKLRIENLSTKELTIGGVSSTTGKIDGSSGTEAVGGNDVRKNLVKQFNELRDQLDKFADDASFNGINLLRGDKLKLTFNETGTSTIEIQAKDKNNQATQVNASNLDIDSVTEADFDTDATLDTKMDTLKSSLDTLRSQSSAFGSNLSVVENRQDFTKNMINTLETGAANLTLADTNEEAANLLALQTRQQLSSTALSMASQADQAVLRLF